MYIFFPVKTNIVTPHKKHLAETILMRGHNIMSLQGNKGKYLRIILEIPPGPGCSKHR